MPVQELKPKTSKFPDVENLILLSHDSDILARATLFAKEFTRLRRKATPSLKVMHMHKSCSAQNTKDSLENYNRVFRVRRRSILDWGALLAPAAPTAHLRLAYQTATT